MVTSLGCYQLLQSLREHNCLSFRRKLRVKIHASNVFVVFLRESGLSSVDLVRHSVLYAFRSFPSSAGEEVEGDQHLGYF